MGMTIYYTAKRAQAMSTAERTCVQAIADRYCAEFPFQTKHGDFCLYSEPLDTEGAVLDGAAVVPMNRKYFYEAILYWLRCLTEITRALPGCDWDVRLDDVNLIWETEGGWRLPTDEEMKKNKMKTAQAEGKDD